MAQKRWQIIEEVFHDALERAPKRRARFLAKACNGDLDLRREVESLLDAYAADPDYLEEPAVTIGGIPEDDVDDGLSGQQIGVYQIIRRIGSGGMGAVYVAERADGEFRQRVALKLVKRGMESREIIRRFRSERQIVAALDHPNIARLFDGGLTSDGRPYFVMEYVEGGVPLDIYCDQHRLDIGARLEIFRTIASAVQYAHQNLVVHRDLKPGNILVSGSGLVKLLDFGIAKPLDPEAIGMTAAMTQMEFRLLTPEYASPEQVRAEPVTTASDVYALGVLLYQLLTGHGPYRLKTGTMWELERAIREEEPQLPSASVRHPAERVGHDGSSQTISAKEIASARSTRPEQLRRDLQGDLDTIIMKAMHKEMPRRYPSVEALSEDVRRYLNGEPVLARKDSLGYRAGKFIGRHKVGVAAASALFSSVTGFGIIMALQSLRIARQARQITDERDKARQVIEFMKEIFKVSNPSVSRGETVTARELLDIGAERIITDLEGNPDVQMELLFVMGDVYEYLGLIDRAEHIYQACLDIAVRNGREESLEYANALLGRAGILRLRSDADEALDLLYRVLDIQRRLAGEESLEVALTLNDIGLMLMHNGDNTGAEPLIRESLRIRWEQLGSVHRDVARSLNNLACILRDREEFVEAAQLQRECLDILKALFGELHPDVPKAMNNLARILTYMDRHDEAETLDRRAYDIRRHLLGDHAETAGSIGFIGSHHYRKGEYERAERLYRESYEMRLRVLPHNHPDLGESLLQLGRVRTALGDFAGAEEYLRQAHAIKQERLGERHPHTARMIVALGDCYRKSGELLRAEESFNQALPIFRESLGDGNQFTTNAAILLGRTLIAMKRYDEAEPLLLRTLDAVEGKHRSYAVEIATLLAEMYEAMGDRKRGELYRERAGRR